MNVEHDPAAAYARALAEEATQLRRLRRWLGWIIWIRIANLALLVGAAARSCSPGHQAWSAVVASAVLFVGFTVVIAMLERRVATRESRVSYFQAGQARLQGRKAEGSPDGSRFAEAGHLFAEDLDIFGPHSLFALLCGARTNAGQATLATWLSQGAPVEEIRRRQQAITELRQLLQLRVDLWLAGGVVKHEVREAALDAWLAAPVAKPARWARILTALLGLTGAFVIYAFVEPRFLPAAGVLVILQRLFANKYRALTRSVQANIFQRAYELRVIARLAERLRHQAFADPALSALVARLTDGGEPASQHIRRLVRLVEWLESRRNQMFAPFAYALLLPEQLCFAIESWRARHGEAARSWLVAIAEIEALASLSTFSFEHPDYPFPELLEQSESPSLTATALGHPLIPPDVRVCNDVHLGGDGRLLVVTGSNMSGKSTLLRTIGVNVVLAQAGAPVCASRLSLTPLRIGASLRAQDSLEQGVSRFFAEIKRLHAILAAAKQQPPILFLLDEILNGTNSLDRREGAEAVVRLLIERGAIGLLTTHDLALADLADRPNVRGAVIHFQDTLEGDRLVFDYRIRPGVVTRRNALDLMRMIGIEIPVGNVPG